MNNRSSSGWFSGNTGAPMADSSLIARARNYLEPHEPLSKLFTDPTDDARTFVNNLSSRARAALENEARSANVLKE